MQNIFLRFFILVSLFSSAAIAQQDTAGIHIKQQKPDSYFRINYDNDFFSATDRYYTQGIYLELITPFIKKSPISKLLIPLGKEALNYYGINFEQDGFTPRSIRHDSIYYGERPYASIFFVSHFLVSINTVKKQRLSTSLYLGIIGPDAKGEEEQKAIHKALKNIQPLGWQYQIAGDYIVNYNVKFEQALFSNKRLELIASAAGRAGTLYDDIGAGMMLRTGLFQGYFKNSGLTKQNDPNLKTSNFQCYVFGKAELKAVGYNATMQGGMFNKNSVYTIPASDITRAVGTAYLGIVLAYKRLSIEYTKVYLSPEFKNGLSHGWGHCNITICF